MEGDEIIIRGELAENASWLHFALLHDAPEENKYSNCEQNKKINYIFSFVKNHKVLILSTYFWMEYLGIQFKKFV